ncbi:hypothetical protein NDU88_002201 [Pleurodeles waltl]|uniref:Uncharacterized protein n=1 Tax=Pleurodeles waltl TaxID=8319 RepID=A0AAV7UCH0_PLEWA|nr:hypothetical protein NDU88_002201 [Pleurodeles waltl]
MRPGGGVEKAEASGRVSWRLRCDGCRRESKQQGGGGGGGGLESRGPRDSAEHGQEARPQEPGGRVGARTWRLTSRWSGCRP